MQFTTNLSRTEPYYFMSVLIFLQLCNNNTCCQLDSYYLAAAVADRLADDSTAKLKLSWRKNKQELDFLAVDSDKPVNSELIRARKI